MISTNITIERRQVHNRSSTIFLYNKKRLRQVSILFLVVLCFLLNACSSTKKLKTMKYKLDFYTSYNQFYIADKNHQGDTGYGFWTQEAHESHLAIAEGIIGVNIESYGHVRAELEILTSKPEIIDYKKYDHIAEVDLFIDSGNIQILNCPDSQTELELDLPIGHYRVRVSALGWVGVFSDDESVDENDFYKIEIWPERKMGPEILKKFQVK